MKIQEVRYECNEKKMVGYAAFPDSKSSPLVLIAPTWAGKDNFVHERACDLANLGYTAFAIDMYGDGKVGSGPSENESLMTPLLENRDMLKQRVLAALEIGKNLNGVDSSKVAAIGYCFGGLVALDLARSGADINGVVSFHGLLMPSPIAQNGIKSKVLVLHGERDPMVPLSMVNVFQQEMTKENVDWQLHSYGGTYHAFTNPDANDIEMGALFNDEANKRSWNSMLNFFNEIFI